MSPFRLLAAAGAAALLASPALAAGECFLQRSINGFSAPNDRTLYVRVGVKEIWRLDLMSDCTGLTFRNAVALQGSPTGGWICHPLDATVILRQTGIRQRCPVTAIHRLTAAEALALPKRDRP